MISAGNTSGCFDLETIEDNVYEEDELLTVNLLSPADPLIIVNRSASVVEIADDDGMYEICLYAVKIKNLSTPQLLLFIGLRKNIM